MAASSLSKPSVPFAGAQHCCTGIRQEGQVRAHTRCDLISFRLSVVFILRTAGSAACSRSNVCDLNCTLLDASLLDCPMRARPLREPQRQPYKLAGLPPTIQHLGTRFGDLRTADARRRSRAPYRSRLACLALLGPLVHISVRSQVIRPSA